jgi:DeoR/GlpR family transcriptional regulator of sugar metabolism
VFAAERRQRILELVRSSGAISLRELARQLSTSEVTVRRDLRALESEGLLDRRHGGAVLPGGLAHEPSYSEKAHVAAEEKAAIAELAVSLVSDGDALVVGAGTTTQAFARRLTRFSELTVVTNSLMVAQVLARARGVEVVMTGGSLRGSIHALVGSMTEQALSSVQSTRAFISGNGVTAERGLSTPNVAVAGVDRALAAAGREVVVLADHTKIGVDATMQTVPPSGIAHLVTDDRADPTHLAELRSSGVQVHVATVTGAEHEPEPADTFRS